MPHIDDGTLHAFLDGALRAEEPEAARRVEAHLEACPDCRARLGDAAELRDRAAGVLAVLDAGLTGQTGGDEPTADGAPRPDFQDVLARAGAGTGGKPGGPADESIRRQVRWTRGLAWAATIVVALGTGYLARDLAGPSGLGPAPAQRPSEAAEVLPTDARGAAPASDPAEEETAPGERAPVQEPDGTQDREPAVRDGGGAMADRTETAAGAAEDQAAAGAGAAPTAETGRARDLTTAAQAPVASPEALGAQAPEAGENAVAAEIDDAARAWQPVTLEEAEAVAGAILVLPGARLAAAEVAGRETRTLQELPGGVEVEVVQAPAGESESGDASAGEPKSSGAAAGEPEAADLGAGEPESAGDSVVTPELRALAAERTVRSELAAPAEEPAAATPTLVGLDLDSVSTTVEEAVTVVVVREGLTLRLTGRLPEDVLRALAATASPRER